MKPLQCPLLALCALILGGVTPSLHAQGTAFTYQGHLTSGANTAAGSYDLIFSLFSAGSGGGSLATPNTNSAVAVSNGLFAVTLAAIQGLNQKVEQQQTELKERNAELQELKKTVNELKSLVNDLINPH